MTSVALLHPLFACKWFALTIGYKLNIKQHRNCLQTSPDHVNYTQPGMSAIYLIAMHSYVHISSLLCSSKTVKLEIIVIFKRKFFNCIQTCNQTMSSSNRRHVVTVYRSLKIKHISRLLVERQCIC